MIHKNILKPIYSLIALALFLVFALASFGPDESSNATVAISNCNDQPGVTGELHVNVYFHFKQGQGAQIPGSIFITHQKVKPDSCVFEVLYNETIAFETDMSGHYSYVGQVWFHDNSEDLFRVEVKIKTNQSIPFYYREVKVLKYANSDFSFDGLLR